MSPFFEEVFFVYKAMLFLFDISQHILGNLLLKKLSCLK